MSRHLGHPMSFQQKDPRFQVTEHPGFLSWTLSLLNFTEIFGHGGVSEEKAMRDPMVSVAF